MVAMIKELRRTLLLSRLSDTQLERVARHANRVRLDEGQLLFRQGDPAERFFLVISGRLRLFRLSPDGAEKVIEIAAPSETFAEALMFLDQPRYPVCAAALNPVELISMDTRDFTLMLRESFDTCLILLGVLSQRLRGLVMEVDSLTLHSATSRFACYLLAKCPGAGQILDLNARKGVIASRLSIKPETFSRIEKDLSERGIISVRGRHVTILDPGALEQVAALGDLGEPAYLPRMPNLPC